MGLSSAPVLILGSVSVIAEGQCLRSIMVRGSKGVDIEFILTIFVSYLAELSGFAKIEKAFIIVSN